MTESTHPGSTRPGTSLPRSVRVARRALLAAPLLAALPPRRGARAQAAAAYPDRPVRLIVPYPPGGSTDVLTRIMAERLRDRLGQPFVVENRPGAGGSIGIDAVAKAAPDGYTLGAATVGNFSINQYLYSRLPHDPERDFLPVALTWEMPNIAVVAKEKVPARTLAEFIAWAKAKPGGITFGSPGVGTSPHLSGAIKRHPELDGFATE
ncbi:tripartite tricarboxylate transporter substrate binding protein, partial [Roseomonas sp. NAR14]